MSNTRKCRELHGGKLTRPKAQWAGKRRSHRHAASKPVGTTAHFNSQMLSQFKAALGTKGFGQLRFNRKGAGDS